MGYKDWSSLSNNSPPFLLSLYAVRELSSLTEALFSLSTVLQATRIKFQDCRLIFVIFVIMNIRLYSSDMY